MAVVSEREPLAKANLLLDRGADVNAPTELGDTALDFARRRNDKTLVETLERHGARPGALESPVVSMPKPAPQSDENFSTRALAERVEKSIALLQKSDAQFVKSTGCFSCHHDVLPEVLTHLAKPRRITIDSAAEEQLSAGLARYLEDRRPRAEQGLDIPGGPDTLGYLLFALDIQGYTPNETTAAWARYLMMIQSPDGRWRVTINRPPLESSDFEVTALALRAMSRFAPPSDQGFYQQRVRAAGEWLRHERPMTTEDRVFRLLGLAWAHAPQAAIDEAARDLRAAQRADGGWAQIDSRDSDAYATGQALYALHEAARMPATDPLYRRGVRYLVGTQHADGSWLVATRTASLQPQFDSGFPYGRDQWISAAGTSWAAIALTLAIP